MEKVLKLYKTFSQVPVLAGAKFLQDGVISTVWSQRNIETGKTVKYMKTHIYDKNSDSYIETFPVDVSQEALVSISPLGTRRAILRELSNGVEKRKQFIEIWTNNNLSHSVDLSALNIHGDVYTDGEFKSWAWSPDESQILYIAEKKLPKTEPFYKRKPDVKDGTGDSATPILGEEYTFRQDWGEQLVGKYLSVIAVYDLNEDKVKILEGVPENLCPGQVVWSPDGLSIIGVALETEPRKLGLIYCTNRLGTIFKLDFNGNYICLSGENKAVACPKFSPDGKYLIWLEREYGGPHHACMRLMKLQLTSEKSNPEIVVDIVKTEITTNNKEKFYGLYNTRFPERCWTSDNRIIFSTNQKCTIKTYLVDIETAKIVELKFDSGSQTVLDVFNNNLLVSRDNYLQVSQCATAILPSKGQEDQITWNNVTKLQKIELLQNIKYEFLELQQDNQDEIRDFTAIYYGPKDGENKKVPLLVWPHGGPHSAFAATFVLEPSIYISLGFAVVFINYRGSIGHGDASIHYLLGRVGTADVEDCVLAAKNTCSRYPWLDPERMGLVGGSHGGFLVHHLSGQYPEMFKGVVSRNPVVDVASMSVVSDIPDWCLVEAGSSFSQAGPVDNDMLLKMRLASPIQHAHKIIAPTYLMLGSKDLRVPCSQGLELMYRLKANGVKVKSSMYDDNHPLGSLPNEMDHIINGALWLLEHVKKE